MKVFIATSGIGSRLLELTKYTNKSMIKIGKKPVISYIIDEYPEDTEFVITLGYFGDHVRQYLELAYPNKKITFVTVDNYAGPGSSQVYSQLQAEKYLQEPFIYHDCDTIIENLQDQIPMKFNYNFLVGYETNSELYDAFDYDINTKSKSKKYEVYDLIKTYMKPDSLVGMLAFVGICGIYDYKEFWKYMHMAYENEQVPYDFLVYHKYGMFKDNLKAIKVTNWVDTGNIAGVKNYRKQCKDQFFILDKNDQAIFIINNKVIKFFAKDGVVDDLLKHYETIKDFCQPITEHTKNFICYDYIDAEDAIVKMNPVRFENFLYSLKNNKFWSKVENIDNTVFFESMKKFYIDKNMQRVNQFKEFYKVSEDEDIYVNDILIPKEYTIERMLNEMMNMREWKESVPCIWHGDFVLDNILYNQKEDKYILLDWRPNFINIKEYGDRNYDFGKMNHNITFNFYSAYNDLYNVQINDNKIYINMLCNNYVYECKEILKKFVNDNYNVRFEYIEMITGACWVSMSPLYFLNPISKLLFYMGKLTLYINLMKLQNKKINTIYDKL